VAEQHPTLVGVIGSPVQHSLSPLLHNTAFGVLGLDWQSMAFEVPDGAAAEALGAMRELGMAGLSVTMPHKAAVAGLVDELSDVAARLDAVNCVVNRDGVLTGTNTDGEGFLASLHRAAGFDAAGTRCLVVGAGGAARAVVLALAGSGAEEVAVLNRTASKAAGVAELAGRAGRVVEVANESSVKAAVAKADVVVNATPVGMTGVASGEGSSWLVPPSLMHPGQLVADLVYDPRPTPWLAEVARTGATTVDGLGMLVHQAAAQLRLWTGMDPPVEAMWQAVTESL
jgi:shikimate dehydrogenase